DAASTSLSRAPIVGTVNAARPMLLPASERKLRRDDSVFIGFSLVRRVSLCGIKSVPQRGSVWLIAGNLYIKYPATRYRVVVLTSSPRLREILLLINNFAIDNRHHALRLQYFQLRNCHDVG